LRRAPIKGGIRRPKIGEAKFRNGYTEVRALEHELPALFNVLRFIKAGEL
jgi:hypothetical protein